MELIEDVRQLLNRHNILYKECHGSNEIISVCLNPSHKSTNYNMYINCDTGVFHCFSCGIKGNMFTLKDMLGEHMSFKTLKTLREQKQYQAIEKPTFTRGLKLKPKLEPKKETNIVFHGIKYNIDDNEEIKSFCDKIHYTKEVRDFFNIQYIKYAEVEANGTTTCLSNRIITPMYFNNELVNIECRTTCGDIPKVLYIKTCNNNIIINWDNIDANKPLIVCESFKNLTNLWSNGYKNIVALGHNILTENQTKLLNTCKHIIIMLDYDKGGGFIQDVNNYREGMLQSFCNNINKDIKLEFMVACEFSQKLKGETRVGYDGNDLTPEQIEWCWNNRQDARLFNQDIKTCGYIKSKLMNNFRLRYFKEMK